MSDRRAARPPRRVVLGFQRRRGSRTTPDLPDRAHAAEHGAVAPGDARHRAHGARGRGRDASPAPTSRSATCTAASRRKSENATWTQIFPYTDRLNYVSPMLNNVGYALAVEKLLGIDKQDPGARAVHPRDRRRDLAHHRPPDLPRRQRDGARRVHRRSSTRSRRASGCASCSRRCRGARLTRQLRAHRRRRRRPARRASTPSCATSWRARAS